MSYVIVIKLGLSCLSFCSYNFITPKICTTSFLMEEFFKTSKQISHHSLQQEQFRSRNMFETLQLR